MFYRRSLPPHVVKAAGLFCSLAVIAGLAIPLAGFAFHIHPSASIQLLAASGLGVSLFLFWLIPETFLQTVLRFVLRLLFRVEIRGLENLPTQGRRLIVANHPSWLDGILLAAFLPEKPVFAIQARLARLPWIKPFAKWMEARPLNPLEPHGLKSLCACVEQNQPVAIFPEGRVSTTGYLMKIYEGAAFVAHKTGAVMVPVHIDGAHLSVFSGSGAKFHRRWFPRITLTIGRPARLPRHIPREKAGRFVHDLLSANACQAQTPEHSLFRELLEAARRHGGRRIIWNAPDGRTLNYTQTLGRSAYLGTRFADATEPGSAVGIMLPTSIESGLTFLGLQFCHRVPAWLNFSMGIASFESTVRTARIRQVVTSRRFVELGELDDRIAALNRAGVEVLYLEDFKPSPAWKLRILAMQLLPSWFYRGHERAWQARGRDPRCVIMFTSGSSGAPKGVALSHHNLLANVAQLRTRIDLNHTDCLFNVLPCFHAFGFTAGMILPLLTGVRIVPYPTPLHYGAIPDLLYSTNATAFFATNSFLNGYARKAHNYDFHALRYVFAGGEKLRASTRRIWSEKFGARVYEGYGTTEAAPVLAMNSLMGGNKLGSVGRLLPCIDFRLDPVPGVDGGRLVFRGPNRMLGYYLPERPGVLSETGEWYDTGDIVSVDDDGFVTILGRAKRFAKIGGEMVSLAAIEEAISTSSESVVAVVSRPHPTKGEELVVCTPDDNLTLDVIRTAVNAQGLSELSVPKQVMTLSPFPLLGSGKPDLVALQQAAIVTDLSEAYKGMHWN